MLAFKNLKKGVQNIEEKIRGHHKWKMFLYAGIIVLILVYIWLFHTNTGWIARDDFIRSFDHNPNRIVRVYADNEKIAEYVGHYSVEGYQDYICVIDFDNKDRINFYGNTVTVVDIPENGSVDNGD